MRESLKSELPLWACEMFLSTQAWWLDQTAPQAKPRRVPKPSGLKVADMAALMAEGVTFAEVKQVVHFVFVADVSAFWPSKCSDLSGFINHFDSMFRQSCVLVDKGGPVRVKDSGSAGRFVPGVGANHIWSESAVAESVAAFYRSTGEQPPESAPETHGAKLRGPRLVRTQLEQTREDIT